MRGRGGGGGGGGLGGWSEEAGEDRDREPGGQKVGSAVEEEREKASEAGIGMVSLTARAKGWEGSSESSLNSWRGEEAIVVSGY